MIYHTWWNHGRHVDDYVIMFDMMVVMICVLGFFLLVSTFLGWLDKK